MADLPKAPVSIDDQASAFAGSTDLIAVFCAVAKNADASPRVYASPDAILERHEYSPGASYAASHIQETGKSVLFCGLPIVTAGSIGCMSNEGVSGTCTITPEPGSLGVLEEIQGILRCTNGGTIGSSQIGLSLSCDGGRTFKPVRLGTATSYTIPYVGVVLSFGPGTLVAGDEFLFSTSAPRWDAAGLQAAREKLAEQMRLTRSILVVGDMLEADDVDDVVTEVNAYDTANERYVYARVQVRDRLQAQMSRLTVKMTGEVTFAEVGESADTITRSSGSFLDEGFEDGMTITVTGSQSNEVTAVVANVTDLVLTMGSTDLADEGPVAVTISGTHTLTFAEVGESGDTITRSGGSWLADKFKVGDVVTITDSESNNVTGAIAQLTPTVMTFGTTDLVAEVIGSDEVSVVASETMSDWIAATDDEFDVDGQRRIDLSRGRGHKRCPITGWRFRRPAAWGASIREYQHEPHIPCWRKADGPVSGWSLEDEDGNVVEYDARLHGGPGRFTCFRTYGNGPRGTFVALSLTRAGEGSVLSRTHNMAVTNLVCTIVQAEAENAIGQVLVLEQSSGRATKESLREIERRVNSALALNILTAGREGPRASFVRWQADPTAVLNVPGAELPGTCDLLLNGTLEKIPTRVRVQSAGA